jgi:NADPH:quinone reductase-like Zn-dependent oxidoreductase
MKARALHSTLTSDARLRLAFDDIDLGEPAVDEVIVRVEAAPINPTDLYLMLAMADLSRATLEGGALVAPVPAAAVAMAAGRLDKPLPVGTEGAGTVVAAGASPAAQALVGKVVAASNGGMYATHRKLPAAAVRELPPGRTAEEGASSFVNPMTALSFVETMRAEGHRALVHTAAASNLGQMLVKICAADAVPLVNIVRRPAHVEQLRALGAEHVVDSSVPTFADDLTAAIGATRATLAFDAIGGGSLASQILTAMERVAARDMTTYSHYGSAVHKQVYIYGSLDRAPTTLVRTFGLAWSVGGYLVSHALRKLGTEAYARMTRRVMAELTTTFKSHYRGRIALEHLLDAGVLQSCAQLTTGEKYLVTAGA